MGFSFHSPGCVKRAKECRNESHAINGSPRAAKTKAKTRRADLAHALAVMSYDAIDVELPLSLVLWQTKNHEEVEKKKRRGRSATGRDPGTAIRLSK
jgi:hypothetical protein